VCRPQAVRAWAKGGFINYFGLQRFGSYSVGTHEIGRVLLKGDFKAAVDLIMCPRVSCLPCRSFLSSNAPELSFNFLLQDGEQWRMEKAREVWAKSRDPRQVSVDAT